MSTSHGGNGGAIVNVSSGAAKLGAQNEYIDYAASKGAIDTMTIGLSKEVAEEGIRVNAVHPGFIYTDMHTDGGEPRRVDRVKEFIPMKRAANLKKFLKPSCGYYPMKPVIRLEALLMFWVGNKHYIFYSQVKANRQKAG